MELIARNFECFPTCSNAQKLFEPLIISLREVRFPLTVGERNSNQLTYGFDPPLQAAFLALGATSAQMNFPSTVKQRYDFAFSFRGKTVAVEIEKANWEKILRDLLKFHIYFQHGADYAFLFLPKNYPHSNGEPDNFATGRDLYKNCLAYGFGQAVNFERILLVGYEQFTVSGERFTSAVRSRLRDEFRNLSSQTQSIP